MWAILFSRFKCTILLKFQLPNIIKVCMPSWMSCSAMDDNDKRFTGDESPVSCRQTFQFGLWQTCSPEQPCILDIILYYIHARGGKSIGTWELRSQKFFWVESFAENFPEKISTFWDNFVYSTYKLQLFYFIYIVHTNISTLLNIWQKLIILPTPAITIR